MCFGDCTDGFAYDVTRIAPHRMLWDIKNFMPGELACQKDLNDQFELVHAFQWHRKHRGSPWKDTGMLSKNV